VDAKSAKLRAESLIRRTEILRNDSSFKGFRASPSFVAFKEKPFVAHTELGYASNRVLVKSMRHDGSLSHVAIQKIFSKSRADLYKRLTLAFNNDCGCGCGGEC